MLQNIEDHDEERDHIPDICALRSPNFAALRAPVFRRSASDGAPVLVTTLGEHDASLTLSAVQRLLDIADDSADGRMLALIAQALDYVTELRPGSPLPAELRTGEASWMVEPAHLQRAAMHLRLGLVVWLRDGDDAQVARFGDSTLALAEADPAMRRQIQAAFANAACELGLADAAAVLPLVADLAHELAFIEALRERLLLRLEASVRRIDSASHGWRGDEYHLDMLIQVRRLLTTAVQQIAGRFSQLATQCAAVMSMLRAMAAHRSLIRSNRDWLYRNQRAFEPTLASWDDAPAHIDERFWPRITATYRFLAPRFMPSQEWTHPGGQAEQLRISRAPRTERRGR